jgi:phosphomannomutase
MVDPKIFKAYDIRAIYGKEIDDEGWSQVIKGTYTYLSGVMKKNPLIVNVGHDMRVESMKLYDVTLQILKSLGAEVNAIDLASTPHSYFALLHLKSDVSMQITASHNPSGYSGMKCVYRDNNNVIKMSGEALRDTVLQRKFIEPKPHGVIHTMPAPLDAEAKYAMSVLPKITKRFKFIADTANGMGVTYLEALATILPIDIIYLNKELDGTFPNHLSDTLQHQYWGKLCETVVKEHANFGIATDGDGDRVAFVNENGKFIPPTWVTCLIMDVMHKMEKADHFLVDVRNIMNVQNYARKIGVKVGITKVGHANITKDLQSTGADFGGESSGHYFFKSSGGAENVMRVLVSVLYKMQETNESFSQTLGSYDTAYEGLETNFILPPTLTKEDVFAALEKKYPDAEISHLDGICISYPEYRMNVRISNTEPLLRLTGESIKKEILDEKIAEIIERIVSLGAKPNNAHQ